jgi:(p)ppGpp synthase/HD superfamily hydrolase
LVEKKHKGQIRRDGTAYINHPIRVANHVILAKQSHRFDDIVIASYLHDTIEDTDTTYEEIQELFGNLVADLVLEVTSDKSEIKRLSKVEYLKNKMLKMSSWALVIKLADRLDNIADLIHADEKFRKKYVKETVEIINYLKLKRELTKTHKKFINAIEITISGYLVDSI